MLESFENKYGVNYYCKNTILVSFPKCGRTWMRMMLARLLDSTGVDYTKIEPILSLHYSVSDVLKNIGENVNILYITRDPRDVVVSYYCEESIRKNRYIGDVSSFIRDENKGLSKILDYMKDWEDAIKNNTFLSSLSLRYEDMRNNPVDNLKKTSKFLNIECDDLQLQDAVNYSSFENMRKVEDGNGVNYLSKYKGGFGKGDKRTGDQRRVRKGKIGGYVDYLNTEDIDYINEKIKGK